MRKNKKTPRRADRKLEIILKADSVGSLEAVRVALSELVSPEVEIGIVHGGVGDINKSDLLLSETAGRLVIGFQVDLLPTLEKVVRERGIEVRLYNVIYALIADIKEIAEGMNPPDLRERIFGSAKVIALFKSSRKGIIIGCEVRDGFLAGGERFRVISAMGPVYSGIIESLHIGQNTVQKATQGQQVGIKLKDFKKIKIGDIVESFRPLPQEEKRIWHPRGEIIRK